MAPARVAVEMRQIAKQVSVSAEVRYDYDKTPYVSVPVGHQVAVEVDFDGSIYYVTLRAWDQTGGLETEDEVGSFLTPHQAAEGAKAKIAEIREIEERANREIEKSFREEEQAQ